VAGIEAQLDQILADNRAHLDALLAPPHLAPPDPPACSPPLPSVTPPPTPPAYSFANLILPLEESEARLGSFWSPVRHLHSVADTEALRAAYRACQPKLTDYATEMGQNERLYRAYQAIWERRTADALPETEQRVLELALRDFRLAGIDLPPAARGQFKALRQELAKLQTEFEERVLDATKGWVRAVADPTLLAGLPESACAQARQTAERAGQEGWLFTLDAPSYLPLMTYADDRKLREECYWAFVTRASEEGPLAGRFDNTRTMERILALRQELARLVGFDSYADYSLATKMAKVPGQVLGFLRDLAGRTRPRAEQEWHDLCHFAGRRLDAFEVPYWSERLKRELYAVSEEDLRPYFPLPKVLQGLFEIAGQLFGIAVQERKGVPVWHPEVRFFVVHDEAGQVRGGFYVDLYARGHKRPGAWMDECLVRRGTAAGVELPVAFLTCNLTPQIGKEAALLTHQEVVTLFHEFGHTLHHLMTQVDRPAISGINGVAWDAVELPSQFLENWAWQPEGLARVSGHFQTGEPLGPDLLARMLAARNFQSGLTMLRQIEFALLDMRLHLEYEPGLAIQRVVDEVREEVALVQPPRYNRYQNSFSHIFAGGYAAGYYSYKWAEVLAADAFGRFEEQGVMDPTVGRAFLHTILERGGSRDPMVLFQQFRGHGPEIAALLRQCGILGPGQGTGTIPGGPSIPGPGGSSPALSPAAPDPLGRA
jgi:oligopeptidase A